MESTFFERWLESAKYFLPGFMVFALFGIVTLYSDCVRNGHFDKARENALGVCLEDYGLLACNATLDKNHLRCAERAYRSSDKFSGLRFDSGSYDQCVFKGIEKRP